MASFDCTCQALLKGLERFDEQNANAIAELICVSLYICYIRHCVDQALKNHIFLAPSAFPNNITHSPLTLMPNTEKVDSHNKLASTLVLAEETPLVVDQVPAMSRGGIVGPF